MKYKLNTYIISLNKSINDFIEYKDLNPIIIQGINGNNLNKNVDIINYSYFNNRFLSKSIIGCALAHIKCWKRHILNRNNYTLILEDDFFIEENSQIHNYIKKIGIKKLIDIYISQTPKDFDILYLGCIEGSFIKTCFKYINMTNTYKDINDFIAKPELALAMHSYIISDSGIVKLLNAIENTKINFHIDTFIQTLSSQNLLKTYITKPRLIYQTSTYKTNSSLSPFIKCPFFKNIFIDKYVSLNYIINVILFSINDYNFSLWIVLLIIFMFLALFKIKKKIKNIF